MAQTFNRCNQCGDQIIGKPGSSLTTSKGGWCGSRRITRTTLVCQDCTGAGEWQQELYRRRQQQEMWDSFTPEQQASYISRHGKPEGVN